MKNKINYRYFWHGHIQDFFWGGTLIENFQKEISRKLRKMHYFSIGNFEKIFKILVSKIANILAYLSKYFINHALDFRPFGRKTQILWKFWENIENFWWKFNWKLNFLFYFSFRKFVTKNRAFGNNTIFSNNLFGSGEGISPSRDSRIQPREAKHKFWGYVTLCKWISQNKIIQEC